MLARTVMTKKKTFSASLATAVATALTTKAAINIASARLAAPEKRFPALGFASVLLTVALLVGAPPARSYAAPLRSSGAASDARSTALRTVQGHVVDKKDTPLTGAVVYLKDTRSLSVKSYLTDESGHFHFGQLSEGADYEIWAEQDGKRSSNKSVSQFNNRLDIQFTLKIDTSK